MLYFHVLNRTVLHNALTVHNANVAFPTPWHERLAHVNASGIESMVRNKVVEGIDLNETKKESGHDICPPCILAKSHRTAIPKVRSSGRATGLLYLVHAEVCGPLQVPSLGGARYFVTFIDDFCAWKTTCTVKRKSEVHQKYLEYESSSANHTGRRMRALRTDMGCACMSNEFREHLVNEGIVHESSTVETPQQTGVSERLNRTAVDLVG